MDFSKLSYSDLIDFLNQDYSNYGVHIDPEKSQIKQAEQLFDFLQNFQDVEYPLPIIDLHLALNYSGPRNKNYTSDDIINLIPSEVDVFAQLFQFDPLNNYEINRERILRILKYLGLIISPEQILLKFTILEKLCSKLSFENLNNFRYAFNLQELKCPMSIKCKNQTKKVPSLTDRMFESVKKYLNSCFRRLFYSREFNMENFEDLEKILEQGADPNIELLSTKMPTALMKASHDGNLKLVKLLLDYGANPSVKNDQDKTALVLAIANRNLRVRDENFEIIKLLLEKDPNPENQNLAKAIEEALKFGVAQVFVDYLVQYLISSDLQYLKEYGEPVLTEAVRSRRIELVEYLLNKGLGIYASEALFRVNDLNIAKLLLSYGANPDYQNENGQTALMNASRNNNIVIVRFLLENGANPNLRNQYGGSVLRIAQLNRQDEIVQLLQSYGAR